LRKRKDGFTFNNSSDQVATVLLVLAIMTKQGSLRNVVVTARRRKVVKHL
jgi:hypothetical protein